ncbi:T9SS type A sorting domain-containing protein [Runella sp. SP2]|uniref:T9SS type A sorting domain-containing protein n=1 Tax=Runella sp. SP2 TaxID=2268026 RepID=UPI000F090243|nr:T9SS type A sorting domain-containing protein [Runella sp. SP2]AYQ30944.1 T9SS C-terminal target domain-containing protein [Runella sp. SP2]
MKKLFILLCLLLVGINRTVLVFGQTMCVNLSLLGTSDFTRSIAMSGANTGGLAPLSIYSGSAIIDASPALAVTRYVRPGGNDSNTGTSWAQAYQTLQKAIEVAVAGDQIWLASGTYYPTKDNAGNIPDNGQLKTFFINKDIAIYGGFNGTESSLSQRNWRTNIAILSGDVGTVGDDADNAYHVVYIQGVSAAMRLDGVAVTKGNANGGDANDFSNPAVSGIGGGVFVYATGGITSAPTINNCRLYDNQASGGGGAGAASKVSGSSTPTFTNCLFENNIASRHGGAVLSMADGDFSGTPFSTPVFEHCTFYNNNASLSKKVGYSNALQGGGSTASFIKCILWGDPTGDCLGTASFSAIRLENSLSKGGCTFGLTCVGTVLNTDPLFVNAAGGDLRLAVNSPAIDGPGGEYFTSAPAEKDYNNNNRPIGCYDYGAFETATSTATVVTCYQDMDGDGYGIAGVTKQFCTSCGEGWADNALDCDDNQNADLPYSLNQSGTFSPVAGTGTSVTLGDDAVSSTLPIGFTFSFFGNSYTDFAISSNGFITFSPFSSGCCSGQSIPNTSSPNNLIALAWDDLDPSAGGSINYFTTGSAPNRKLIVNYVGIPIAGSSSPNVTSQIILYETSNLIEIHSTNINGVDPATMGIENASGTIALAVPGRNRAAWSATNDYVAFVPVTTGQFITTFYRDMDGDGFGNPSITQTACTQPSGYVTNNTDCNDNNALEKPGQVWYKDTDNDNYAETGAATITQCLRPLGYKVSTELLATSGDCNDNNSAIRPGTTEICDGIDNNCNGSTDEGCNPDYTITTTGGGIIITDAVGNGETLNVSQNSTNIRFDVTGRTYSLNGGTTLSFPADVALAGASSITVNNAAGNDIINVGTFTANLPSLTINGGTGDDEVIFNGDITFAANANLDLDLQNDDLNPGVDAVRVALNANVKLTGTGTATVKVSKNVQIFTGGSLETVDGNLLVEANQQSTATSGTFYGVLISGTGSLLQSTGNGSVTVKGTGGNNPGGDQLGVFVTGGGQIHGNTVNVVGKGGASGGEFCSGVIISGTSSITSSGGNVSVTGTGGSGANSYGIDITGLGLISTATNGGNLSLIANSMNIQASLSTNSVSTLWLRPFTAGMQINLGSSTDPTSGPLSLSDAELDRMTTGTLIIGDATAGAISFSSGGVTRPASTNVQLISGGDINVSFGGFNTGGGTLLLDPGSSPAAIKPTFNGTDVTASTLTLGGDLNISINGTGSAYSQLKVVGGVNLSGSNLVLSGTPTLVGGETFVIVDNDGTDAISSTFSNFSQGATLSNFLNSGLNARISYTGGTNNNDVVITVDCVSPATPIVGTITQPTCALATGSVALSGLPSSGTWTLTRNPGSITSTGSGSATTVSGLASGTYTFTVTNDAGCVSLASGNVEINSQPSTPSAPVVGTITQPTCSTPTGSVVLSGLPSSGQWTLTRNPGSATSTGTGATTTVSGLASGTYTFTVTNDAGCVSLVSGNVEINSQPSTPSAPVVGTITQPTCTTPTGSVVLSGLPSSGTWTLTRNPGSVTSTGSGSATTVSGLASGIYTFTVTNDAGCTSLASGNVEINSQPSTPNAPVVGTITQPTCALATGSVALSGLPSSGQWTLTRNPGSVTSTGTGATTTVSGLASGIYTFTVTNDAGCVSLASGNVEINSQPSTPSAPVVGTITQPTCSTPTGSVVLSGLPSSGQWTLTRNPGSVTSAGSGSVTTVSGLSSGTYTFTVTNDAGCTSVASGNVEINSQPLTPSAPVAGTITQPTCALATGSVALSGLPSSGQWTLTRNPGSVTSTGSGSATTVSGLVLGTYTFTVTNDAGCVSLASGNVEINSQPLTPSAPVAGTITQPTCALATGSVALSGLPSSGQWTLTRNPGSVTSTGSGSATTVSGLSSGTYTFTVTNDAGCTSVASGNVEINSQPSTPSAPVTGTITQPTCALATGSVALSGLPSSGTWTLTRNPGSVTSTGTGATTTVSGLSSGIYTFTVTNDAGCVSLASGDVDIIAPPSNVSITTAASSPICAGATSFTIPYTGTTGSPISYSITGTGITSVTNGLLTSTPIVVNLSGPATGNLITYTLTVSNAGGCVSPNVTGSVAVVGPPTISLTTLQQTLNEGNSQVLCDTDANPVNGLQFTVSGSCVVGSPVWRVQVGNGAWSNWSATAPVSQPSNNQLHRYQAACDANCASTYSGVIELTINNRASVPQNVSLMVDGVTVAVGETKEVCSLVNMPLTFNANCSTGEVVLYSVDGGEYSAGVPVGLVDNQFHNYRVRCRKSDGTPSCVESESGVMRLKLVTIPSAPTVSLSSTASCDATASFSGQSTCGSLRTVWYNATTNVALPSLPATVPSQTTSYYARCQTENGCVSEKSNVVTFTLTPTQVAPVITASQEIVCTGTTVTVSANCPAGSQTFWNTGVTAPSFEVAFNNVTKQTYWAKCLFEGGCQSVESMKKDIYWNAFVVTLINIGESKSAVKPANDKSLWTSQFITRDGGPELEQSTQVNPTLYYVENANKMAPRYWTINVEACGLSTDGSLTFDMLATPEMGVIRSFNTHENNAPYFMYANREGWTELYAQNHPAYGFYQDNGAGGNSYDAGLPKGLYKLSIRYWDQKGWGSIYPSTRKPQGNVLAYQEYWFRIQSRDGVGVGAARAADSEVARGKEQGSDNGQPITDNGVFATVMPNPVSNILRLKVQESKGQVVQAALTDASGREVLRRQFVPETNTHQEEFGVNELADGLYFLRVSTPDKSTHLKVIKVH